MPGNFIDANQVALDLLECSINELRKLTPLDILASHGPEDFPPLQDDFLKTGRFRMEMVVVSRKGRKIPIEVNARLVDFSGTPYVMTVARDITEQKRVEEQLRQSEEKYRTHFEKVHDIIYAIDSDMLITSVTPSIEGFLGYAPEEFVGKYYHHCMFVLQPEYLSKAGTNIIRLLSGEQVGATVYGFITKDGRKVYGEIRGTPIIRDGNVAGLISVVRDVTDRIQAEHALRESEERYRNLVNLAPLGIVEIDLVNDRLLSANDTTCKYSGYSKEELLSIPTWSFFTEESLPSHDQVIAALAQGGKIPDNFEFKLRTKSGKEKWILFNARHEMEGGKPVRSTGILSDITVRKEADIKLRESEQRLRTILEHMPVMLAAIDESGKILAWNSECEKVTGYRKDKLERSKDIIWRFLFPSQVYRKKVLSFISEQNRYYLNYETTITCNDGTERIISWSNISRLFPVPGWYSWIVGLDITEMRLTEKGLRQKQDELNAVINNIPDLVWLKSRALQYALINRPLEIFSGVTNEAVSGSSDISCRPADKKEVYLKRDMDVVRTGAMARHEEVLVNCKGQKHIVDCVRMPITDKSGAVVGVVGICHNITEQKLREEELQAKLDTVVLKFEEKSDELMKINAELKMKKSELENERAELESIRQQVVDNSNALSILARNMENVHRETEH
ncbi:MAG: PAS domain-containing protein [Deltaproteobacteria bacterium]|nr:PAS domain-containing protein [Deltaproteobacteria bacterium]